MSIKQKKTEPKPAKSNGEPKDARRTPKKSSNIIAETTPKSTFKATSEATQGEFEESFEQILNKFTIDDNGKLVEQLIVQYYLKGYMSEETTFPQNRYFQQLSHTNTRNKNEYIKQIKPFFEMIGTCNLINYFAKDFAKSLRTIHSDIEKEERPYNWKNQRNVHFSKYEKQDKTKTDTFMDYLVNNEGLHAVVTKENLEYVFGNAFIFQKFHKNFLATVAETTLKRKSQNEGLDIIKKQKKEAVAAVKDTLAAAAAAAAAATAAAATSTYNMMKEHFNEDENSSSSDSEDNSNRMYHDNNLGKTTGQSPEGFRNFVLSLQHYTSLNVKDSEQNYCPCSASKVAVKWRNEYGIGLPQEPCKSKQYTTHASMMQHMENVQSLPLYHKAILHYGNIMSKGKAVTLTTSDTADKVMEASVSIYENIGAIVSERTEHNGLDEGYEISGHDGSDKGGNVVEANARKEVGDELYDEELFQNDNKDEESTSTNATVHHMESTFQVQPSERTEHNGLDEGYEISGHDGSDKGGNVVEANARKEVAKRAGDRVEHENADDQTGPDNNGDELCDEAVFENDNEDKESTSTNATVQHMESTFQVKPGNYVSLRRKLSNETIVHDFDIDKYAIAEVKKTDSGPAFSFVRVNDEGRRNGASPILKLFPPYGIFEGAGKHFYEVKVEDQWVRLETTIITLTDGDPMFINSTTDRLFSNYEGEDPNLIAEREAFNEQNKRDEAAKAGEKVATMKAEQQRTFHSDIDKFGLDLTKFKTLAQTDVDTQILGNVIDPRVISAGTSFGMCVNMYGQVHLVQDGNLHGYSIGKKSHYDAYQFIDAYCSSVDKDTIIETLNLSSLLNSLNLNEQGLIVVTDKFTLSFILEGTIANMYRDGIEISVTRVTCPSRQWQDKMKRTLRIPKADDGTYYTENPFSLHARNEGKQIIQYENKCVHIPFEFMSHLPQSVTLARDDAFTTVSQLLQSRFKANSGEISATLLKDGLRKNPKPSKPAFALNKATISVKKFVDGMAEVDKRPRSGARVVSILESRVWHYLGKMTAAAAEVLPQVWVTENYEGRKLIFPLTSLIAGTMVEINKACFGAGKDRGITGPLYRTIFNSKDKPTKEQKATIERCTELLGNKMLEIVQSWSNFCCEFQWDAFAATAAQKQMLILTILTNKHPDIPQLLADQGIALHRDLLISQVLSQVPEIAGKFSNLK